MKIIKPSEVTDSIFVSSTVPEDDHPVWNAGTNYTPKDRVIRTETHKIYESITGGVSSTPPEDALGGTTPEWIEVSATNRWAMFDDVVGTITTSTSDIVVEFKGEGAEGIAFLELVGTSISVQITDNTSSSVVYTKTVNLDGTEVGSFYEWFYADYQQLTDLAITDLNGSFTDTVIQITLTTAGGTASCGVCKFGKITDIGCAEYGASFTIEDFSKKETDQFGFVSIVERPFIKRTNQRIVLDPTNFNKVTRLLSSLRATPSIYITVDEKGFEPLIVYGFYSDFSVDVAYPSLYYCTLEIQGLI